MVIADDKAGGLFLYGPPLLSRPFLRISALSLADIKARPRNVRFTPKSGHPPKLVQGTLRKSSARGWQSHAAQSQVIKTLQPGKPEVFVMIAHREQSLAYCDQHRSLPKRQIRRRRAGTDSITYLRLRGVFAGLAIVPQRLHVLPGRTAGPRGWRNGRSR